ncbi:hypothetical protein [Candidatus Planktophila vernalis]|uniref:hypothetical protein n=1 Tax=Candidatus Planktophila vernalis TaxID=1884907 RepID=UPI0016805711|nr:hypothetical protein [Candidatus Planktophila vernalis]
MILLGKITAFGIDEDGYLEVFRKIYSGSFDIHSQISWPTNSTALLQLIYLPAKLVSLIGIPDYLALRIQSSVLFYITCWIIFRQIGNIYRRANIALLIGLMFLPSIFVWTSLGLRESYIFFWITLIWLSLHKLIDQHSIRYLVLLALSVNGLATTKIYLYTLALFMGFITLILLVRSKGYRNIVLMALVLLSPLLTLPGVKGELISGARSAILSETASQSGVNGSGSGVNGSGSGVNGSGSGVNGSGSGVNGSGSGVNGSGSGVNGADNGQTLKLLLEQLNENSLLESTLSKLGILDHLSEVASVRESENESTVVSNVFKNGSLTNVSQLVLAVIKFLVLPIPFANNGSYFMNLQSIESPLLYLAYFILFWYLLIVTRKKPRKPQLFFGLCLFAVLFTVQSALIEINLGTLVRHRSILILIIVLATVEASTKLSVFKRSQTDIKS